MCKIPLKPLAGKFLEAYISPCDEDKFDHIFPVILAKS